MTREKTPPKKNANGGTRIRVQRCCNGCGREIGDATAQEVQNALYGLPLPDVRPECGCADLPKVSPL